MIVPDFIGPQLPPDDILYRRGRLSKEHGRKPRHILQLWLKARLEEHSDLCVCDENFYVILGDTGQCVTIKQYLELSYGGI